LVVAIHVRRGRSLFVDLLEFLLIFKRLLHNNIWVDEKLVEIFSK
jgi:hypothetical protein